VARKDTQGARSGKGRESTFRYSIPKWLGGGGEMTKVSMVRTKTEGTRGTGIQGKIKQDSENIYKDNIGTLL